MPLLHLQLQAPENQTGTTHTDNPTFTPKFGHEFFQQDVTLRTVSISTFDPAANDKVAQMQVVHTTTPGSHNTMWIDLLTDQQLNSREVNTNVNDASSFPIPFDYSRQRPACQQYTSLDYTFNLSHLEPGNGINIRCIGSNSNVNNYTRWSSDEGKDDAIYQIDLTFEYAEIGGLD